MAEFSGTWTTGTSGDGTNTYTQAQASGFFAVLAACSGFEGVAPGYLSELLCQANGANTVQVGPGGGVVDGKAYSNSANVDVNIPSAVGGGNTRIDRIVLRAVWASYTVRITRIAGTNAASPSAPAMTQTSGTTYDISLCTVLVNTSGAVTVTDARTWAHGGRGTARSVVGRSAASNGALADIAATADGQVLSNTTAGGLSWTSVSAAMIAAGVLAVVNLTDGPETIIVPIQPVYNLSDANSSATWVDAKECEAYGMFRTPADYVSGGIVVWMGRPGGSGNIYHEMLVQGGGSAEAYSTHSTAVASAAVAMTNTLWSAIGSADISAWLAAGDNVLITLIRHATSGSDTVNAAVSGYAYFTYTANHGG